MTHTPYSPPVHRIRHTLDAAAGLSDVLALDAYTHVSSEMVDMVLAEAGRFAADVLAPLNAAGDREGSRLDGEGQVHTPQGFSDAYRRFCANGWPTLPFPTAYGGQGLPHCVGMAVSECWDGANMAFALCPMLTRSAAELLLAHGNDSQRARYLPRLVSGEWTGTMCLTEPDAGSDLSQIRATAEPADTPGRYRLRGTKIFITWGAHDLTENILHLVLARLPGAPEGTRGISLFLAPTYRLNEDGTNSGKNNGITCASLEHKMGIHASPTAVLHFGEHDGTLGELIGEPHGGLKAMFTMMNQARLAVGLEGMATAECALQLAASYAAQRVQGRPIGDPSGAPIPIAQHPDIRQTLKLMHAHSACLRGLVYHAGSLVDLSIHHPDSAARKRYQARLDWLTPIVKAHASDTGFAMTSHGVQVHGGMGYIEETGAAQLLRDSRISMIYEGTNGIQALDLAVRKLQRDRGIAATTLLDDIDACAARFRASPDTGEAASIVAGASRTLRRRTEAMHARYATSPEWVAEYAGRFLTDWGLLCEAWMGLLLCETGADDTLPSTLARLCEEPAMQALAAEKA